MKLESNVEPRYLDIATRYAKKKEKIFQSLTIEAKERNFIVLVYYKKGWIFTSSDPSGILVIDEDNNLLERKVAKNLL